MGAALARGVLLYDSDVLEVEAAWLNIQGPLLADDLINWPILKPQSGR
jgi:hypothetical protein